MRLPQYLAKHKKNDDRPYLIGGAVVVLASLILGIFALAVVDRYLLSTGPLAAVVASALADLANGDRAQAAERPLAVSPALTAIAQAKADDMAAKGYFSHVSPDGKDPWYWFDRAGYDYSYAGENLAVDFSDSNAVEEAWMHSPEHRANLLSSHFTEVGIATAAGTYEGRATTFVVEEFAAPAAAGAPKAAKPRAVSVPRSPTATALSAPVASATPAVAGAESVASPAAPAPWWARVVASPQTALRYAYYALAAVVLALLAYATGFEFHRRHLRHVAAAGVLLVLMAALIVLGDVAFFSAPVLAAPAALAS